MLSDAELIRKLDFFDPLEEKIIKKIAKACIVREFQSGDYMVKQGESGLGLYFITSGRAKVEIERGGVRIMVAELQGGDVLGELSMIDDKARSANVICTEESRCLLLTRDSFLKLLNKYPEIGLQMAKSLVARIRATNERVGANPPAASSPAPDAAPSAPEPVATDPVGANGSSGSIFSKLSPSNLLNFNLQDIKVLKDIEIVKTYSSTKSKTKDFLVDLFQPIYLMKEMTRFSMAIVGCPVTVQARNRQQEVLQAEIGGVKVVVFPASGNQVLSIDAYADGRFSTTIFRPVDHRKPSKASVACFEGDVRKHEILRLHVPAEGGNDRVRMIRSRTSCGTRRAGIADYPKSS